MIKEDVMYLNGREVGIVLKNGDQFCDLFEIVNEDYAFLYYQNKQIKLEDIDYIYLLKN